MSSISEGGCMNLVSVILTTYNRPQLCRQAISSVRMQTYPAFELLIIDDGSHPAARAEVRSTLEAYDDPRLRWLQTGRTDEERLSMTSYCAAINVGLHEARGEYITYLCDDDLYAPRRLEVMVDYLDSHPEAHVVYGMQRMVIVDADTGEFLSHSWLNGRPTEEPCMRPIPQPPDTRQAAMRIDHSSIMHRRACLDKVGLWPTELEHQSTGDAAFFHKLQKHYTFYFIAELTDIHRFHDESMCARLSRGEEAIWS